MISIPSFLAAFPSLPNRCSQTKIGSFLAFRFAHELCSFLFSLGPSLADLKMAIHSEEVNYLVYRYLQESGSVLLFKSKAQDSNIQHSPLPTRVEWRTQKCTTSLFHQVCSSPTSKRRCSTSSSRRTCGTCAFCRGRDL